MLADTEGRSTGGVRVCGWRRVLLHVDVAYACAFAWSFLFKGSDGSRWQDVTVGIARSVFIVGPILAIASLPRVVENLL